MKPVVISGGRQAGKGLANKIVLAFYFPKTESSKKESGEIELISGDVPRIIVKASAQVVVDRLEIEGKEDRKR